MKSKFRETKMMRKKVNMNNSRYRTIKNKNLKNKVNLFLTNLR